MYNPCIPQALKSFEDMTGKHRDELRVSSLEWFLVTTEGTFLVGDKIPYEGSPIQMVPSPRLVFKFGEEWLAQAANA